MNSPLAIFEVYSHEFNQVRQICVVDEIEDRHLNFVEKEWVPRLTDSRARAVIAYRALPAEKQHERSWQEKQGRFGAPDAHWNWGRKNQSMMSSIHRMFALLDGEAVEALMRVDLSKPSRLRPSPRTPIMYIDYLAVAPWNRSAIQSPRRFRGLGKLLLGAAVSISVEEGMDGRCGLHSLPQSEGFYSQAGMQDFGVDAESGLSYFEFSPDMARKFLEV